MTNIEIKRDEISIVLCGAAGQGVQTVETLLTKTLKKSGFYVFATREYMRTINLQDIKINKKTKKEGEIINQSTIII